MKNKIAENPQAFPIHENSGKNCQGMTLRDYFAAKAMQALITKMEYYTLGTNKNVNVFTKNVFTKKIPTGAYDIADAMLEERIKGGGI